MSGKYHLFLGLVVLISLGCAKPKVVQMDGETYLVQKRSAQLSFGPPVKQREEVYTIANEFCASQGKVVETINLELVNQIFGRHGSASLQFRCVPPSKPVEAKEISPTIHTDIKKRLGELKSLFESGTINKEEYEKKRKEIIDKL